MIVTAKIHTFDGRVAMHVTELEGCLEVCVNLLPLSQGWRFIDIFTATYQLVVPFAWDGNEATFVVSVESGQCEVFLEAITELYYSCI